MNVNINSIVKLSIWSKLVIAFFGLSTIPLLVFGFRAIHVHTVVLERNQLDDLNHEVMMVRERTNTFLSNVISDMRLLSNSSLFRNFLTQPNSPPRLEAFRQQLVDFLTSKPIYYEIRFLDKDGREMLNVRESDGQIVSVPPTRRALRYYLYLTEGLRQGELVSAPVELRSNRDTLVAVLSYALPVFKGIEQLKGILVVDVFAADLFRTLDEAHDEFGGQVVLVSDEGYYLYHSKWKKTWSQLLATRHEHNVYRDYHEEVARQIMSDKSGILTSNGRVIAFTPLLRNVMQKTNKYTLFVSFPREQVLAPVIRFKRAFYLFLGVFTALSVVLGYFAAAQFTRPINALQTEARVIAGGEFGHRLQVETYDEIQQLAETFNAMAAAIQSRELQIQQHRSMLEATVEARTRELAEEKGKLQAILDSVPSAFVLIARDMRILSVNRAFESIVGYDPEMVVGQHYGTFFPDCKQPGCKQDDQCPALKAFRTGEIASDVRSVTFPGRRRTTYIERIAIPMSVEGMVEQVIEMVTDVTERKEMEAQVLHAEKLATTGEMAAVIAHEMRNSLTTVKMILQLESEREDISDSDGEALAVATSSLKRMETVVQELLDFARPSPPQLGLHSLTVILRESLSLIQHHIYRRTIALEDSLDPNIPLLNCDADQLKEAFVNLLLNAVQAVPESGGTITVSTRALVHRPEQISLRHNGETEPPASSAHDCWLEVTIEDTGCGIPEGEEDRIFDPFFTTKPDGTGLGLSMVKRTVEAHGGRIMATNLPTGGARFTVWLTTNGFGRPEIEVRQYGATESAHRG